MNYIKMYACGVTPYNDCHLGHAKVYSTIDLIVRAMRMTGKKVQLVMNITDIDQKIINKSKELNCYWKDVSRQYEKSFFQDMKKLNVEVPNVVARITDYVPEIVAYIQKIIDNGFAYVTSDGSVYFDSKAYVDAGYVLDMSDPDFDNIDGSDDGLETVDKLPFLGKKNKIDFALWKSRDKEDVGFEAQFKYGDTMIKTYGLIGWHIECSTIIHELIGPDIQVHFGGIDLKFPHHYNEIIQANAYYHPKFHPSSGEIWCPQFIHVGHLCINGQKMSKSLKNFTTIAEGLKTMTANQLRLLFMMHDYRNPLTFNDYIMNNTKISDQTIKNFFDTMIHYPFNMDNIKLNQPEIELRNYFSRAQLEITDNLNNLNLHLVSTSIFELINKVNAYVKHNDPNISLINEITRWLSRLLTDLGFSYGNNNTNSSLNDVMSTLIETRTELRNLARDKGIDKETKYKLFSILDSQRDVKLSQIGIILKDTKDSSLWHVEKIEQ